MSKDLSSDSGGGFIDQSLTGTKFIIHKSKFIKVFKYCNAKLVES